MPALSYRRVTFSLLALAVLLGLLADALQHRHTRFNLLAFVRGPAGVQTRDDAALLSGWLEQVDNSWEVGKNHQRVRSAFRRVVSDARRATVSVKRGERQVALGTVVDPDGYILTKASEVVGDQPIVCQFYDRRSREAERIGVLPTLDLAMLKVDLDHLTPAHWSDLQQPPAVGSLLATSDLSVEPLAVGVVSLAPVQIANDGVLGIQLSDTRSGPRVNLVIEPSAAAEAGIQHGDLVLQVDERTVSTSEQLVSTIQQRLPGDQVALRVRRGDSELTVNATLGRRTELDQENSDFQSFLGGQLSFRRTGFSSVLQHDTFLLPEHCGGPVCDLDGRVVGINIARAERIASYALPASVIVPWLDDLKAGKYQSLTIGHQLTSTSATQ